MVNRAEVGVDDQLSATPETSEPFASTWMSVS
jgi:hypothetical protein